MTLNLGMVRPGSTILVPFHTFTSDDPSASVAITGFALADIGIYKGSSMTERASTTGVVLLGEESPPDGIDLDTAVGIHGFSIDLSSNATAGFYSAGAHYYVTVGPVTVDAATVNFVAATFSIGFPDAIINTTVASATSDTQFILTDGPAEADVLIGCPVLIQALASAGGVGIQIGYCTDYIVTTKEVILAADPGGGTVTAADHIGIFMPSNVRAVGGTLQTAGDLAALIVALNDITAASVWAVDATTQQTQGTFGQAIGDPVADTTTIYQAVATDATGDNIAVDIVAVKAVLIVADTGELQTDDVPTLIAAVQSDTDNIQTRLPAALVGGAMDSDVSAMQAGVVTAAAVATDAIDADALATDAVNEIRDAILPKKNTALPNIEFLMVDSTDHVTPKTGLTLTINRSIDGGAFGSGTGTAAEVANGIYQYDASAADVNGGIITFRFSSAGADDTFLTIRTGG